MKTQIKTRLLITLGWLSVLLGLIGIAVPILPTTPFLILALTLFSKSSPRFHQALLNNRWFGETLQKWEKERSMSPTVKRRAQWLIVVSFTLSIYVLKGQAILQIGLAILGLTLLFFLRRVAETPETN